MTTDFEAAETRATVEGRGRVILKVRDSTFVGHAAPATDPPLAEAFVAEVVEAHPDATHHVPAYRVTVETGILREYASDAGEPSGSAGRPVLRVLQRRDLEDVVVVVARYFGGTKLGVGGLARAYASATGGAIESAGVVERRPRMRVLIEVGYPDSGTVQGILEQAANSVEAEYGEQVQFDVHIPIESVESLIDRVLSATSGRAELETRPPAG